MVTPMPSPKPKTLPTQLHVKLADRDARKLVRLSMSAKLTISEVIRSMIRSTAAVSTPAARKKKV